MAGDTRDDTGAVVPLAGPPQRVVSLVPSLTETVAATAPGRLAGATDWCSHPAGLGVPRVRGTKNPELGLIQASLRRMLTVACGLPAPGWLDDAAAAWAGAGHGPPRRAVIPVWRRPWMVLGRDTFAGDVLARLGVANLYAGHAERYPKATLDQLRAAGPDLIVLPDEPYHFTAADGPECFPGTDCALVSGRHLTWYGPSLVDAPRVLARQLGQPVPAPPTREEHNR
jgi:hypothetical protein